jgi:hypothetical protein
MSKMARIEVQDQFGRWQRFQTVSATDISIKLTLQRALKTQLAAKSKKVRAVDEKTGTLTDILQE